MKTPPYTFALDIGGTAIKAAVLDSKGKIVSNTVCLKTPIPAPPQAVIQSIRQAAQSLPVFDRISVGFPGVVRRGTIITAPNLGTQAWQGVALDHALNQIFKKPVRILNDADMQGLAVINGKGLELVVTLGTGVGTAFFRDGELMPHLELAHHPVATNGKTYNEYLGDKTRKKIGNKTWNNRLRRVIGILHTLMQYDALYLGGGNSRLVTIRDIPGMTIVPNEAGLLGGIALWKS